MLKRHVNANSSLQRDLSGGFDDFFKIYFWRCSFWEKTYKWNARRREDHPICEWFEQKETRENSSLEMNSAFVFWLPTSCKSIPKIHYELENWFLKSFLLVIVAPTFTPSTVTCSSTSAPCKVLFYFIQLKISLFVQHVQSRQRLLPVRVMKCHGMVVVTI